jgi:opacity protein-like surface antigen
MKITVWDDLEAVTKNTDFGWVAGGGVQLPLSGQLALDLGVQYRIGIMDVFDRSFFTPGDLQGIKGTVIRNSALSFQIGLRVPVNR